MELIRGGGGGGGIRCRELREEPGVGCMISGGAGGGARGGAGSYGGAGGRVPACRWPDKLLTA
jgi:hypothetical protein